MGRKRAPIGKISRPRLLQIYSRDRLHTEMNKAVHKPMIWVVGPAGCGKTSMVADYIDVRKLPSIWYQMDEGDRDPATFFHYLGLAVKKAAPTRRKPMPYLTPEYIFGMTTFAKRYFEKLFNRISSPFLLVFDNYQEIERHDLMHEVLAGAFDNIPTGFTICIISREEPGPAYARLRAAQHAHIIDWSALRFTREETQHMISMQRGSMPHPIELDRFYEITHGWVAGLILLLQRANVHSSVPIEMSENDPSEIFDYFAAEVLKRLDKEEKEFLLQAAFLPYMTAIQAEKLTGCEDGGKILNSLVRKNYFIERRYHPELVYQFHPLFREFLVRSAGDVFSAEHITAIQTLAGHLLEKGGQLEMATELYWKCDNWEALVGVILSKAPLLIEQGRFKTLYTFLKKLPANLVKENQWLLYWQATSCFPFSPMQSKVYFEEAYTKCKSSQDKGLLSLSWAGLADSVIMGATENSHYQVLDQLIDDVENVLDIKTMLPIMIESRLSMSMVFALEIKRPDHPNLESWADRCLSAAEKLKDLTIQFQLLLFLSDYYLMIGNISKLRTINQFRANQVQRKNVPPPVAILNAIIAGQRAFFQSPEERGESLLLLDEAFRISQNTGLLVWNIHLLGTSVMLHLSNNDVASAHKTMERLGSLVEMTKNPMAKGFYQHLLSIEAFIRKETAEALQHVEKTIQIATEADLPYRIGLEKLTRSHILLQAQNIVESKRDIDESLGMARKSKSRILEFYCLLTLALYYSLREDERQELQALERGLAIGREQGYYFTYTDNHLITGTMCATALEHNIEVDYVKQLIKLRNLKPPSSFRHLDAWPWPIKIYTFDHFQVTVSGQPLLFKRGGRSKPLTLLRAIIAGGAHDVSETKLSYQLWPDAEGDAAHIAFTTTLHRLRKLLGIKEALVLKGRKVSLNPEVCWVDISALDELIKQAQNLSRKYHDREQHILITEHILEVYQGAFLAREDEAWLTEPRDRIRNRVVRQLETAARSLEDLKTWRRALALYEKGIAIDPLKEQFHRGIMRCYREMDLLSEALVAYQNCCNLLQDQLGISPSAKTHAIGKHLMH